MSSEFEELIKRAQVGDEAPLVARATELLTELLTVPSAMNSSVAIRESSVDTCDGPALAVEFEVVAQEVEVFCAEVGRRSRQAMTDEKLDTIAAAVDDADALAREADPGSAPRIRRDLLRRVLTEAG